MSDVTCPYCGKELEVYDCEAGQDENIQIECNECGKTFIAQVEYNVSYYSRKAACLNGGKHDWEIGIIHPDFPRVHSRAYCRACNESRPMTDEEYNTKLKAMEALQKSGVPCPQ